MRVDIISLFPEMFDGPMGHSIIKRARDAGRIDISVTNPRDYANDKHRIVDDTPYGGGAGMVMKAEPLFLAVEDVLDKTRYNNRRIILMCPSGTSFNQSKAIELAEYEQLVLICGHYEGIDERVREHLVDESLSIGDFVLTGGELPAMVVVDAVARMLPGVLGDSASALQDSFYSGFLEYPHYTKPREFRGWHVPEVLLNGDHAKINRWRRMQSLRKTLQLRPDLLRTAQLSSDDKKILAEIKTGEE